MSGDNRRFPPHSGKSCAAQIQDPHHPICLSTSTAYRSFLGLPFGALRFTEAPLSDSFGALMKILRSFVVHVLPHKKERHASSASSESTYLSLYSFSNV